MRLTKKLTDTIYTHISGMEMTVTNKLGQLEDIEEELGIDLITLFKAEKDGIWYNSNGTFYFNYFDVSLAHRCFRRYVDYFRNYMSFDFKDYGKTWALTKEELEK